MKRIFRFRAVKTIPFDFEEYLNKQFKRYRKNYCEMIFGCSRKTILKNYVKQLLIIKVHKNGKLM